MTIYDRANDDVTERGARVIEKFHPLLKAAGVTIDYLWASGEKDEPAIKLHGAYAYACIRVTNAKERAAGRADAEMLIDKACYEKMSFATRDALLDHEIYHLKLKTDRFGANQVDDHRRPILKMRSHDRQFGWFDEIAKRHGEASVEVQQAQTLKAQAGQVYFEFEHADV